MRLAEGVAARDQRGGFGIVHVHCPEGAADVGSSQQRIGIAVRAFWIDVDQAHLGCGKRTLEVALAVTALIVEQLLLRPPEHQIGLPCIDTATGKAERLEAHVLHGDIAREDHEIAPRQLAAILLLDRPDEATRLVEVHVIGPGVERLKAQFAAIGTAAAVTAAIGPSAVPGHADEEGAVVPIVRRPPRLRGGQHLADIGLDCIEIEAGEFLGIVEIGAIGIGLRLVLAQRGQVNALGPPLLGGGRGIGFGSCGGGDRRGRDHQCSECDLLQVHGAIPLSLCPVLCRTMARR